MSYRYLQVLLLAFLCVLPSQLFAGTSEKLEVFVSIPPLKWLCEQLGSNTLSVNLLIAKGQAPHAFEPSPKQIQALSRSSLFFTVGMAFEGEIVRRLHSGTSHLKIVDTSKNINKIPIVDLEHEHRAGEILDPHVWLSPPNLKSMVMVMADALSSADPENAMLYQGNLKIVQQILDDLDKNLTKDLAPFNGASFFVFHPAFGYFANRYHMKQVAVETGGKSPTPKQLFALIRKAKAHGVKVIFVQPQFDPRSAQSIATAIGGRVVALDPLAENSVENMKNMAVKIGSAMAVGTR